MSLYNRELSPSGSRGKATEVAVREIRSMRRIQQEVSGLKMEGECTEEFRWPCRELREAPGWQPARKWGPHLCSLNNWILSTAWINLETHSLSEHPDKGLACNNLISACETRAGGTHWVHQSPDLQDWEIINLCHFKWLKLW